MHHYTLFDGLNEADIEKLLKISREKKIAMGETIIHEGEAVPALYILKSGQR